MPFANHSFFRKNKAFSLVLLLQLLVLLALLVQAVSTPAGTLSIGASHFASSDASQMRLENHQLIFEAAETADEPVETVATSYRYPLGHGAYEVTVHYTSSTTGNALSYGATLMFQADHLLEQEEIRLYDNRTSVSSRLWLPFLDSWDDLLAVITYHGEGDVTLQSIELAESIPYRFMRLLGFALLFALADLLYWLLLSDRFRLTEQTAHWLVMGAVVFVASIPFLNDFLYEGHDLLFHTQRISALAEELKNLQFPVRMFTAPNHGFGYPTPLYYCDVFLYLPALLYNCMLPMRTCFQAYVIAVNLATCLIAYASFSAITGQKRLGLLGAALYTLCIYRLTAVFLRSALGEYTAMAFLPLVMLGMYRLYTAAKPCWRDWLPLSIGMSCIILSHIITTELVVFNLALLCLLLLRRTLHVRRLLCILKAAGLCALLTVWFWLPFLQTYFSQNVNVQSLEPYLMEFSGLYFAELFSLFVTGTGYSILGGMQHSMPITIGASLTAGLVCMLVCALHQSKQKLGESNHLLRPVLLLTLVNLLLTLHFFPWYRIQDLLGLQEGGIGRFLNSLQHSWRMLSIASALITLGTLMALQQMAKAHPRAGRAAAAALAAVIVFGAGNLLFEFTYSAEETSYAVTDPHAYSHDTLYFPRGSSLERTYYPFAYSESDAVTIHSYHKEQGVARLSAANESDAAAAVEIPIFAYRHYQACDAGGTAFELGASSTGCITLTLPPRYCGVIEVRFVPPWLWRAAEGVSLLTLIALLGWGLRQLAHRRQKAIKQSI